jgi:hypothetical protein
VFKVRYGTYQSIFLDFQESGQGIQLINYICNLKNKMQLLSLFLLRILKDRAFVYSNAKFAEELSLKLCLYARVDQLSYSHSAVWRCLLTASPIASLNIYKKSRDSFRTSNIILTACYIAIAAR